MDKRINKRRKKAPNIPTHPPHKTPILASMNCVAVSGSNSSAGSVVGGFGSSDRCWRSICLAQARQNERAVSCADVDCTRRDPKYSSMGSSVSLQCPCFQGSPIRSLDKQTASTPRETACKFLPVSAARNASCIASPPQS